MASNLQKKLYLNAMGIPLWSARRVLPGERKSNFSNSVDKTLVASDETAWHRLQIEVSRCTACDLNQTRNNVVFGAGDPDAELMIIGEAPGEEEDRQGEPFVGRAGQLLNQMLEAVGLNRASVFITNILKCHPPKNRDPKPDEVNKCSEFLLKQIQLINPKVILSVGAVSAHSLLQKNEAIGQLRGQEYQHPITGTPIIVTYHPAYLLRSPLHKSEAWHDLVLIQKKLAEQA